MKKREDNIIWTGLIKIQRFIIIVMAAGTTLVVGGAMILRETVGVNFIGFEEILIITAFWLYMIGCGHGTYEKSQITADILNTLMPECFVKDLINFIKSVLSCVLSIVFMIWAVKFAQWAIEMNLQTPVFRVPMALGQGSIFIGMILTTFYNIVYLYDDVKAFVVKHSKNKKTDDSGNDLGEARGV